MADARASLSIGFHSIQAEQALLGSLLIDSTAWAQIATKVETADFFTHDHRLIFAAISNLQSHGTPIDAVIVSEYLERKNVLAEVGGLAYIGRLARDTPTAANVETYADTVRERSIVRSLDRFAGNLSKSIAAVGEHTAAELVAKAQEQLQALQVRARSGKGLISVSRLIGELTDDMDARLNGSKGLPLGLPDLDELTTGLEPGELAVIAARPGMGKTALLVSVASTVSQSVGTAIFSAEMPSNQLMRRCMALQTAISQGRLRRPEELTDDDWKKISDGAAHIAGKRLWIDDTGMPSLTHIRAETLGLKSRESIGLLLVDYVQLVQAPGANRYEQLRDVAYGLKALAKEMQVPIVVLAQLNRDVERREHKRPNVSDLRDSGAIEEAADIIGLLYSEGYYNPGFPMPYVLECEISKNRNGERGHCLWRFDGAYSRVSPLDSGAAAQYKRELLNQRQRGSADI